MFVKGKFGISVFAHIFVVDLDATQNSGVYLRYDVLTNGGFPNNDGGYTLVHETGQYVQPNESHKLFGT